MTRPVSRFYTPTMARLYAEQGYLRKAAQIYGYLLRQEPARDDLAGELKIIEEKISRQTHPSHKEIGLMLREWADMVENRKQVKRKGFTEKGGDDGNQDNG